METLEKEKFETVKQLADLNLNISKARNELLDLESKKDEFIEKRGEEALNKINEIFQASQDIIDKTKINFNKVHELVNVVLGYRAALESGMTSFEKLLDKFEESSKQWEKTYEANRNNLLQFEKELKEDRKKLDKDKKDFENFAKDLKKWEKTLIDKEAAINRKIKRFKQGKI